jgi:hypothetical protein
MEIKEEIHETICDIRPLLEPQPYEGVVQKHQQHDQSSHGNWAHGSSFGDFTLEEGADSRKLATYSHPNGTRVIFQNLSKVESSSPMLKETLETIDGLSKKYPVPNLTFVVQSGEGGGIVARGYDGIAYSPANTDAPDKIQEWLEYKKMPPATDPNAPYIAIRQRVIAPDSMPRTSSLPYGGTLIRREKTQEEKTAYLKELITHEWGHALDTRSQAVSNAQFRNRDNTTTSTYGNKNGREFFAETFAAFELGGLVKDRPDNIPNYKKASEYLDIDSLKGKVSKESFEGFVVYENFETEEPLLIEGGTLLDFDEPFAKHGTHDQSTHGNWATGGMGAGVADSILARVRENGGLSVNMVDGSEPTSGYMVAKGAQFGSIVSADDFYDPIKGPKALADYFKRHKKELGAGKNYLGVWHNKDDGQVYLDVSENIQDRERAISAGQKQDQISIWDVTNFAEIETGGTGSVEKTGSGRDTKEHRGDDRFGDRSLRSENLGEVGKAYKVIRFEPGLIPLFKHQEHDQSTHGNWAGTGQEVVTDIEEWNKAELAKYPSQEAQEAYLLDRILSQRMEGFTGREYHRAVDSYQTLLGYTMNEALRDPNVSTDQVQYLIAGLDGAIESAPLTKEPMTVYRGIKGNGLDFFEGLKKGDIFTDRGFVSTSLDTNVATKFSVQGSMYQGIVMRMRLPAGTAGLFPTSVTGLTSLSSREAEFLLPRDSKFKILNNEGKVWDVELVND